jgi:hypothetical protein
MPDLAEKGALSFEVGHEDADWPTNGLQYNFHQPHPEGIWVEAYKRANGRFEVELKNYVGGFHARIGVPLPLPGPDSPAPYTVHAQIGWWNGGRDIVLAVNGTQVAKGSAGPLEE